MKRKIATFYILLTSLCFSALALNLCYSLGYRVNRSASLPFLIYKITPLVADENLAAGDCVIIDITQITNHVIDKGVERGYVNSREPMLKQIGAVPGDTITLKDNSIIINNKTALMLIVSHDSYGGELSAWPTPVVLSPDQYWLISDPRRGFDSRYFGPVNRMALTHRARAIF